jgi:hypothetical protein
LLSTVTTALIIIDELYALNDLVVKLLYESLRTEVALIVEVVRSNATDVLDKVLPQALSQPANIFGLSQTLKSLVAELDAFVVVQSGLIDHLPLVLLLQIVQRLRILDPFFKVLGLMHFLKELHNLVLLRKSG